MNGDSDVGSVLRPLTIDDLKNILGRALIEQEFRDKLKTDPAGVLLGLGVEANPKRSGSSRSSAAAHSRA